jgi:hypothetical protein
MENKDVNKQQTEEKKLGWFAIGGIFIVGYIIGCSTNSKAYTDGYSKGVADTLRHIVFRMEK